MTILQEHKREGPVVRAIEGSYIVWFEKGNQFLRMEEPAYWVFQCREKGISLEGIICQCAEKYHNTLEESRLFVTAILDGIDAVEHWKSTGTNQGEMEENLPNVHFTPFSKRNYLINGKLISFHFETPLLEYYLHPLLSHLQSEVLSADPFLFELFEFHGKVVLRVDQQIKGKWNIDESHLINGMVSLQLLNVAYERRDQDWMAILHASAVTNGAKTIVFTAKPGSGKSTMAAMLHKKGFLIVSDDFVPLDRNTSQVFPFPAAMTVKAGAVDLLSTLYPTLNSQNEPQISRSNKLVHYLPVEPALIPAPVKEIIFIKYDPAVNFELTKVPCIEALQLLLDETWTSPSAENAGQFLDWYKGITCYRLTYSNNDLALLKISELFEKDRF